VINLVDQQGEIRAKKTVNFQKLSANDFLVGVLSSNGSLLNSLAGLGTSSNRRIAVAHLEIADLPETLQGWSALDMLIFNDIDSAQLSTVQRDLLRHWLYAGGRLVIGGGPNAAQTLAGLSNILPYENIENVILPHPIPELDPLHSLPLEDRGPYVATNLSGSILSNPQAASIAAQDNLPLITSLSRGEGEIIYIAFDLSLAPMDTLLTQKASLKQLFRQLEPRSFSFLDLPGGTDQIETSMSLIPGLSLPRPWTIALYLIAYIILVGPLNYLILGRFKKREWMWGTIPLIILIFCGIGYARGYGLSGRQIILRQLTVINGQADNAQVTGMPKRAQPVSPLLIPIAIDTTADNTEREPEIDRSLAEYNTFVGVFSTQRAKYKITIDDAPLAQPLSSYNQELNISYGEPTTITDLYGEIGSMPIALARGQLAMPDVDAQLRYDPLDRAVRGRIFNNTGRSIEGTYLVYGSRGLNLDSLPPGETTVDGKIFTRMNQRSLYGFSNQDISDEETLRWTSRDMAAKTVLGQTNSGGIVQFSQSRAIYLLGWQEDSPVQATLPDRRNRYIAETLLFIRLSQ